MSWCFPYIFFINLNNIVYCRFRAFDLLLWVLIVWVDDGVKYIIECRKLSIDSGMFFFSQGLSLPSFNQEMDQPQGEGSPLSLSFARQLKNIVCAKTSAWRLQNTLWKVTLQRQIWSTHSYAKNISSLNIYRCSRLLRRHLEVRPSTFRLKKTGLLQKGDENNPDKVA